MYLLVQDRRHSDSSKYARLRAEREAAKAVVVRSRRCGDGGCDVSGHQRLSLGGHR